MTDDELKRLLDTGTAEVRSAFETIAARLASENRQYFDASTEAVNGEIQLVAEAVATLDEKGARQYDELREEVRRGFSETQAMIKFSHAELDRRVRALEQAFTDLRSRVERLETSTH